MDLEKAFPLLLVAMFVAFGVVESIRPARPLPKVAGWKLRGVLGFIVTAGVSGSVPLLYMDFIRAHRLGNLESLGIVGGAALGVLVTELVGYWVHRASHANPLWRLYHQVHHSAERVDVFGAAYFHPLEIAVGSVIGAVFNTMLLGISAQAAALGGLFAISLSFFQHTNLKTPRWLGYVIQRPESHSVHHERGRHALNYSRLAFIDWMFGTLKNPEYFAPEAGFYPGASSRTLEMLVGTDVSTPRANR